MKRKSTILILMMVCFITLIGFTSVKVRASEKDEVLRGCERLFGKSIDEKLNLFEINRFYVLRVKFDKREKLEELAVEPKYYFESTHEDWKEPDDFTYLSKVEYENLVAILDAIKTKGVLVKPSSGINVITNATAWRTEFYEKASLTWGELVDWERAEDAPYEVKWFSLNYEKKSQVLKAGEPMNVVCDLAPPQI